VNDIQVFSNPEFGKVRALTINNEPWFVGKDIAGALGYSNSRDALAKHVGAEDKNTVAFRDGTAGNPMQTVINESGVYALVFSSKLPDAKKFKHWVTSEVLPSIRKHGAYMSQETLQNALLNPDFLIQLATELKTEKEKTRTLQIRNSELTVQTTIMKPKAEYFDDLVDRSLLTSFTDAAKELGIKRKDFIGFLIDGGYIYRDKKKNLMPRANVKTEGLFEVKQCSNAKTKWAGCQTLLTPKGMETFRMLYLGA